MRKWLKIFGSIMERPSSEVYRDREDLEKYLPEGSVNAYKIVDILSRKKEGVDSFSCVLELLEYACEIIENDNQFYQAAMCKSIEVDWELPPYQRQVSVTKHTGDSAAKMGCKLGIFTPPEIKLMKQNWKDVCTTFGIPNQPESLARWRSENNKRRYNPKIETTRREIVKWLARGLERTLHQVYNGFVQYYSRYRVGPYNKREKKVMKIIFKWAKEKGGINTAKEMKLVRLVCILLCREKRGVLKFMNSVLTDDKMESIPPKKWTLERSNDLLMAMLAEGEFDHVNQLKDVRFSAEFWRNVASNINEMPQSVRLFWYKKLHMMLFVEEMLTIWEIGQEMRKIIESMDFTYWQEVNFHVVCERFPPGYTPLFLKTIFFDMVLRGGCHGRPDSADIRKKSGMRMKYLFNHMSYNKNKKLRKVRLSSKGVLKFVN